MRRRKTNVHEREYTYRKPVIHHSMAMVAAISSGRMQAHDHLIPVQTLAQHLWEARQIAFRQPLQLTHHLLAFVYGVEALHPKHNSHLDLQGQHAAKRFVFRIDQPTAVHLNTTSSWEMTSLP